MAGGLIHDPSAFQEAAFRRKIAAILRL